MPVNHSVWIQHGHDLKYKIISENFSIESGASEIVNDALHHPASPGLAWMHSSCQYDSFPHFDGFGVTREVGYYQHFAIISGQGLAERASFDSIFLARVCLNLLQVSTQIGIGVGVAMREVNNVAVIIERNREGHGVVIACVLTLH